MPNFQLPAFSLPDFTLDPLNPELGVNTPSARGLFPWGPSTRTAQSAWAASPPAENLKPIQSLSPEREAANVAMRRRAVADYLSLLRLP